MNTWDGWCRWSSARVCGGCGTTTNWKATKIQQNTCSPHWGLTTWLCIVKSLSDLWPSALLLILTTTTCQHRRCQQRPRCHAKYSLRVSIEWKLRNSGCFVIRLFHDVLQVSEMKHVLYSWSFPLLQFLSVYLSQNLHWSSEEPSYSLSK